MKQYNTEDPDISSGEDVETVQTRDTEAQLTCEEYQGTMSCIVILTSTEACTYLSIHKDIS